jgi:hypothetical protein
MTDNQSTLNLTPEVKADKPLTGIEKRQKNLVSITDRTPEEQFNIRSLGGKARQEQIKKQRTMKEQALIYLQSKVSKETATKYLGTEEAEKLSEEDLTVQGIMIAKMAQEAMDNGNAKAAEFVRDTSGQRPKDIVEVSADIITASDRDLLANIADRYRAENDENS